MTGSADGTLRLWSVSDGGLIKILSGHKGMVNTLAANPTDDTIASGSRTGEVFLWDGRVGKLLKTLTAQHNVIGSVVFSPNGAQLLTTAADGAEAYSQRVFDTRSGRELVAYNGHDNTVLAAAISPDGRLAATAGGTEQEIHLWNLSTGEVARGSDNKALILRGTGAQVFAVGVSADSARIQWGTQSDYKSHNDRGGISYELRLPDAAGTLHDPVRITSEMASTSIRAETKYGSLSLEAVPGGQYGYEDAILSVRENGQLNCEYSA